jgi:creatinine amidohydrolase
MKKLPTFLFVFSQFVLLSAQSGKEIGISYKMEELTSPQFVTAVTKSGGVCVLPLGIIEKHGPQLPLGTDLFEAREIAFTAARQEYAVIFPPYFTGQIFEARHQPGAIAYTTELMWKMLEETCTELSRNGLKKIILLNGHGGNTSFLQYFCQAQLAKPRDYIVVLFQPDADPETQKEIASLKKTTADGHAGEEETSMISYINPDLIDKSALKSESGADQARLKIPFGYTGIWWYAKFPNHYAGDGSQYSSKLGGLLIKSDAGQLAELIRYLKTDNSIEKLQQEFYKRTENAVQK